MRKVFNYMRRFSFKKWNSISSISYSSDSSSSVFISSKIIQTLQLTKHDIWQQVIMLEVTREASGSSC